MVKHQKHSLLVKGMRQDAHRHLFYFNTALGLGRDNKAKKRCGRLKGKTVLFTGKIIFIEKSKELLLQF